MRAGVLQQVDVAWERLGQSRFGYARRFNAERMIEIGRENGLGIISFENWDLRGIRKVIRKLRNLLT
jgi:hypothetical protein